MGLFSAMTTSVAGLNAQAFALQNISGNIANSQTTAYKGIDTNFADIVSSVGTTVQDSNAGSVRAISTPTNSVQGAVNTSGVSTNMAINGQGYFQVQMKTGTTDGLETFSGTNVYTRAGDFTMDKQGYLVNSAGAALMAIPIDPATQNPIGDTAQLLQISNGYLKANPTTRINYQANLPASPSSGLLQANTTSYPAANGSVIGTTTAPTTPSATYNTLTTVSASDNTTFQSQTLAGSAVTAYTSTGTAVNVQMRWAKVGTDASGNSTWNLFYQTNPNATGTQAMWANAGTPFVFNSTGAMVSPTGGTATINPMTLTTSSGSVALGTGQGVAMNFGTSGLTQYDSSSSVVNVSTLSQNGYTSGSLSSVGVDTQGRVTASYSNGVQVPIAQVPTYKFNGDSALTLQTGGVYVANNDSGPAVKMAATNISGGALEASNTDIATQFSKMIVTQQAYSANSKVITTANSMMQDVMQILR
jgi:flagellar hook protein FlgE